MEREMEKFKTLINRDIRLEAGEKEAMRDKLVSFVRANPTQSPATPQAQSPLPFFTALPFALKLALSGLVLAVVGGGASVLAEHAVPGDALYGIKTSVNEPVQKLFVFGDKETGLYAVRMTERRLAEAEKLASSGALSEEVKDSLRAEILKNIENVHSSIVALRLNEDAAGAIELSTQLESSLRIHEQILSGIPSGTMATTGSLPLFDLISTMKKESSNASGVRAGVETSIVTSGSVKSKEVALQTLADVQGMLQDIKTSLPNLAESSEKTEQYLQIYVAKAQALILSGKENLARGEVATAFTELQQARTLLKEVSVLAESRNAVADTVITGVKEPTVTPAEPSAPAPATTTPALTSPEKPLPPAPTPDSSTPPPTGTLQ